MLDALDDRADRFGQRFGDLRLADADFLRHAVHQVAALDLHHQRLRRPQAGRRCRFLS
jgi:hypothetical protein